MKMIKACSNSQGCVWVGLDPSGKVLVSNDPDDGPYLEFTQDEWEDFLAGVHRGEFTVTALTEVLNGTMEAIGVSPS